jgi:uncharacterized Zn finger protein
MKRRGAVVGSRPFSEWERLLFHIDQGMSWESVRNLEHMQRTVLLIQNIAAQSDVPDEVTEWIQEVRRDLDAVLTAIAEGEIS